MNEHEFRGALRMGMFTNPEPPPMDGGPVLEAAHRDRRRRRAVWAGAGSAVAVVAVAMGVVVLTPSSSGGLEVADTPSARATEPPTGSSAALWPNGQTDNLATSGPEYDKAGALLADLVSSVPAGFEVPDDLVGGGDLDGVNLKRQVAQNDGRWAYHGQAPLVRGHGVGQLEIMVFPVDPDLRSNEGCEMGPKPGCAEKLIDGKRVGVFDHTGLPAGETATTAVYRGEHSVVRITQATFFEFAGLPGVDELPFTADELAELVTDPRFQLD